MSMILPHGSAVSTRRIGPLLCLAVLVPLAAGCATGRTTDLNRRLTSLEMVAKKPPNATYVVDPPDAVRVDLVTEAAVYGPQQIRSDGCITLPMIGDTQVAGMTTAQIQEKLEGLYSAFYKDPSVLVTVTDYRSKHIYVYGEVRLVGQQPYTGWQTLADAIGSAGGVTNLAATSRVKVIRGDPDSPEIFKANLDKLIYAGDTRQDVSLAENDVVYVPPHVLAWIGYQMESLLFPLRGLLSVVSTAPAVASP